MRRAGLIALGGAVGALARLGALEAVGHTALVVLLVNATGAFGLGALTAYLRRRPERDGLLRPLLGIGLLGAFTTFSSFAAILAGLPPAAALAYAAAMVALGAVAALAGLRVAAR